MSKRILHMEIYTCEGCPYQHYEYSSSAAYEAVPHCTCYEGELTGVLREDKIHHGIPDWCPLEIVQEEEKACNNIMTL